MATSYYHALKAELTKEAQDDPAIEARRIAMRDPQYAKFLRDRNAQTIQDPGEAFRNQYSWYNPYGYLARPLNAAAQRWYGGEEPTSNQALLETATAAKPWYQPQAVADAQRMQTIGQMSLRGLDAQGKPVRQHTTAPAPVPGTIGRTPSTGGGPMPLRPREELLRATPASTGGGPMPMRPSESMSFTPGQYPRYSDRFDRMVQDLNQRRQALRGNQQAQSRQDMGNMTNQFASQRPSPTGFASQRPISPTGFASQR